MQLSKWELVLLLELNPVQIKWVITLLTRNPEAGHVNTHHMIALLILARNGEMTLQEKIWTLMDHICYQVGMGQSQKTEI
jgi:hypothetical protein